MMLPSLSTLTSIISPPQQQQQQQQTTFGPTPSVYSFPPLPPLSSLTIPPNQQQQQQQQQPINSLSFLCLATQQHSKNEHVTSNVSPICPTPLRVGSSSSSSSSSSAFQPRSSSSPTQHVMPSPSPTHFSSNHNFNCNFNSSYNHNEKSTVNYYHGPNTSTPSSIQFNNSSQIFNPNEFYPLKGFAEAVTSIKKGNKSSNSDQGYPQDFLQVIKPKVKKSSPTRKYRKLPKPPVDLDDFHHKPHRRAYKKKPKMSGEKCCSSCGTNTTPEWRKGPDGPKSLCNACGLQYAKASKTNK